MEKKCIYGTVLLYLLAAAVMDIRTRKVSLRLAALFAVTAAVMEIVWHRLGIFNWFAGLLPGVCLLITGRITRGAVGYGDGAVLLVCGCFLGAWNSLGVFLLGLFLACPVSLAFIVLRKADRKTEIPFVPFLLAGYGIWLLAGI